MPTCWNITLKGGTDLISPATLDEEICEVLDVPCDDNKYYLCWWDSLGLAGSFEKFREIDFEYERIADYLESTYELHTWYEVGGFR